VYVTPDHEVFLVVLVIAGLMEVKLNTPADLLACMPPTRQAKVITAVQPWPTYAEVNARTSRAEWSQ
jgi:hypothetical protein